MENLTSYLETIKDLVLKYGLQFLGALAILILGFILINAFSRRLRKTFEKRDMDPSLQSFLRGGIIITLKVLLLISILAMVGIEMTSFIAIMGAAGLAIGLAMQGTLQNFAGGVIILLFKPFKVGDYIETQGYSGTVKEIQIFNTVLKTPDNKTIILPNSPVSTSSLINYSTEPQRRVEFTFGISYNDDIDKAKGILNQLIEADDRILTDPAPQIVVGGLADSSVNIIVRAWVNSADYWNVYFETLEAGKKAFDREGISIPFPQQDVHVYQK